LRDDIARRALQDLPYGAECAILIVDVRVLDRVPVHAPQKLIVVATCCVVRFLVLYKVFGVRRQLERNA
jgi:hypothetical protein